MGHSGATTGVGKRCPTLVLICLALVLLLAAVALTRPSDAYASNGPLWVDALDYGSAGGGFYWDSVSGEVWIAERGWHLFSSRSNPSVSPFWVNDLDYISAGGGFYWDPTSGQVWTAERTWHNFDPSSWNWNAWVAILSSVLKGNIVDLIKATNVLTTPCGSGGQYISVDNSLAHNSIQGCIDTDAPEAKVRVVNLRSIYFTLVVSNDTPLKLLKPGESVSVPIDVQKQSPVTATALLTSDAADALIVVFLKHAA